MAWRPTNCAVQRSFRDESTGDAVKVTPARPGEIFHCRCIVPIKTAGGIDQTELGVNAPTSDDCTIVPSACREGIE
jgi:hypothetical protein